MLREPLLAVTVDTEADNQWTRDGRYCLLFRNIRALPRLESLFEKYGVRPTYLLTYDVASDPESAAYFKKLLKEGRCEIGAHFHPWTTPPIAEEEIEKGTYPHHLSAERHYEKMMRLTKTIEESIGVRPVSFRAGRWGFDGESLRVLEKLGYRVDSSVTPFYSWEEDGGPVFVHAPTYPYFPDSEDVCREGKSALLEVPVTIGLSGVLRHLPEGVLRTVRDRRRLFTFLQRIKLLTTRWLRPTYTSGKGMIRLSRNVLDEGGKVLTMMFHSSEIIVGGSPHHSNEAKLSHFFNQLEEILSYLIKERGLKSCTLSEVYTRWIGNGSSS